MLPLIINVITSAGVGALIGRFICCRGGVCLMFANWKRGMAFGAFIGLLNGLQFLK